MCNAFVLLHFYTLGTMQKTNTRRFRKLKQTYSFSCFWVSLIFVWVIFESQLKQLHIHALKPIMVTDTVLIINRQTPDELLSNIRRLVGFGNHQLDLTDASIREAGRD